MVRILNWGYYIDSQGWSSLYRWQMHKLLQPTSYIVGMYVALPRFNGISTGCGTPSGEVKGDATATCNWNRNTINAEHSAT